MSVSVPTVEALWRKYAALIFRGVKVNPVQHGETRQAYYCGATDMLRVLEQVVPQLGPGEGSRAIIQLREELLAFHKRQIKRAQANLAAVPEPHTQLTQEVKDGALS